jgi:hypothetical protein
MFSLLTDRNTIILQILLGSQQKSMRAAPPPPPISSLPTSSPSTSNNNEYETAVTLNPDIVSKFTNITNQNDSLSSKSPLPHLPPRNTPGNNTGGTIGQSPPTSSDFADSKPAERRHDPMNTGGALIYDHDFENRFRFTPIENLPPPQPWKPPPPPMLERKSTRAFT